MGIEKNIGKNTIGDNNKMKVYMHDYNMSTHDLSTITRTCLLKIINSYKNKETIKNFVHLCKM